MRLCLLLLVLLQTRAARAQEEAPAPAPPAPVLPAPPLVDAEAQAEPPTRSSDAPTIKAIHLGVGDNLIIYMPDGLRYSGEVLSLRPGEVTLKLRTRQEVRLLVSDVQKLEQSQRPWAQTTLAGGGVGALAGTVVVGFFCLLASTEGDVDVVECTGGGALVGAVIGGGAGLIAGLATVTWSTLYEKEKDGELSLQLEDPNVASRLSSGVGRRGELGLQLGYARDVGISNPTEGWGGRIHVFALSEHFAIGPEFAFYANVGDENQDIGQGRIVRRERSLVQFHGLVRGSIQAGPVRPALLVGLGVHSNRNSNFGGTVGAELEMRPFESLPPLALDARFHINLDRNSGEDLQNFLSLGLGSRVRW